MQSLYNELKIEIFKYIETPMSLALTNHEWNTVSQDPYVRASWLIHKYGRARAFFHAVRLGKSFLTSQVIRSLLLQNAIVSRYFMQRLLMNYGTYDEQLIKIKASYNAKPGDVKKVLRKLSTPRWGNLPLPIF